MVSRRIVFLAAATAYLGVGGVVLPALADFGQSKIVTSNAISTATLSPPTSPSAAASCNGPGVAKIDLAWTASASSFADGYDAYRSGTSGGPYAKIGHVAGRATVTYTDSGLALDSSYFYILQATASNWTSVNSAEVQAITPAACP